MDAVEAIYSAWKAHFDADSGAGGLRNTSGNQYVVGGMFRDGDPQITRNNTRIEVSIVPIEADAELGARHIEATVRNRIVTKRDLGFARQNAVEKRLIARFKDSTSLTATGWSFSPPVLLRPAFQSEIGSDELAAIVEFIVHVTAA